AFLGRWAARATRPSRLASRRPQADRTKLPAADPCTANSVPWAAEHHRRVACATQSGIALVMTLVMLSVITIVAVAFLALSQREKTMVTQSTQQSDAEIMSDIGTERAKAEIMARILAAHTN